MFSQVIKNVAASAAAVLKLPNPSSSAATIKAHATSFSSQEIPALQKLATDITAFSAKATGEVAAILKSLDGGATPASQKDAIAALSSEVNPIVNEVGTTNTALANFRGEFVADTVELQKEEIAVTAQAAGMKADQKRLRDSAASIQMRIDAMSVVVWIPIIGWIIKGASELESLIADQKSTEATLSDANNALAGVNARIAQYSAEVSQIKSLQGGINQLTGGVQNVTNTINMIQSKLNNGQGFLSADSKDAKLFLVALQSSLRQLSTLVS